MKKELDGLSGTDVLPPPRSPARLFLISFVILFVELSAIRWLNSTVQVLVYFNNLILISCFFGLGLGCLLARRRSRFILGFGPGLLTLVLSVLGLGSLGFEVSYETDVIFVGNTQLYTSGLLEISAAALAGFALNFAFFMLLGQELGRQLAAFDRPLVAYAWDIGGSLAGVLAYALVAWLRTPPHVWYGLAVLALLVFVSRNRGWMLLNAVCAMLAILLMRTTYSNAEWSPYYKVEQRSFQEAGNKALGFQVLVDNLRIQDALAIGPELARSNLWPWLAYYEIPYHFKEAPERVLILGAGTGNEALIALVMGAREVDAVEIDPVIADWGRRLHPHRPYSLPQVDVHVDDARSWVSATDERYDVIVMSALDSHKQVAGASSLRLESYVYTVESFRTIRELLKPDGIFCLSLASTRPWMGERTYWSLAEAFGRPPRVYTSPGSPFRSVSYLYGPEEAFARDLLPEPYVVEPLDAGYDHDGVVLATDDWPHLYLAKPGLPALYVVVLVLLILTSTGVVVAAEPAVRRPNLHFFFLGAGFMLLETRSVTQFALLFGTTWNVNAIVFAAILATILIANTMVHWNWSPGPFASYAILFPVLVIGWLFPTAPLLSLTFVPRLFVSGLVIGLPILWASFLFSLSFRGEKHVDRVFGSNLLGIVFGGSLEYLSSLWGLNALYLVALVIYAASAWTLPRKRALGLTHLVPHGDPAARSAS